MDWQTKLGDRMRSFGTQIVFERGEYRVMNEDDQKQLSEIIALEQHARAHGRVVTMPAIAMAVTQHRHLNGEADLEKA
jgi:hypothetical protein